MKVVIAPDKFKGTLSAAQVAEAIAQGVRRAAPDAEIDVCPMADGGEGTVDALVSATNGRFITHRVTGPLPEMKVDAKFGMLGPSAKRAEKEGDAPTAVIEMAAASGLHLLKPDQLDPMATTTFGTGELIRIAVEGGARCIILGIGGSATCDGGIGALQACGFTIVLDDGEPVSETEPLCGRDLSRVVLIKRHRGEVIDRVSIEVACDVTNPLFGPNGAAPVFAPQKGATPAQVAELDHLLEQLATRTGHLQEASTPGAGAAGGLGFGLLAFAGAKLRPGVEIVIDAVGLADRLRDADLCFTGEGKFDASSLGGKAPIGVLRLCEELHVPCALIAGSIAHDDPRFVARASLVPPATIEDAFARGPELLAMHAQEIVERLRQR
jgi:glycerate kinase